MRRIFYILNALLVVAAFSMTQQLRSQTREQSTRYFCGIGRVVSIDGGKSGVTINHQTIKRYMPAMTMHFKAEDPEVMDHVVAGDTVRFTLKDTPELTRLIYIEKIVPTRSRQKKH
jgi:Cu/Ag efflux protein CusF